MLARPSFFPSGQSQGLFPQLFLPTSMNRLLPKQTQQIEGRGYGGRWPLLHLFERGGIQDTSTQNKETIQTYI